MDAGFPDVATSGDVAPSDVSATGLTSLCVTITSRVAFDAATGNQCVGRTITVFTWSAFEGFGPSVGGICTDRMTPWGRARVKFSCDGGITMMNLTAAMNFTAAQLGLTVIVGGVAGSGTVWQNYCPGGPPGEWAFMVPMQTGTNSPPRTGVCE